jgi:hypothetical protein
MKCVIRALIIWLALLPIAATAQLVQLRHWTGQSVAPVYEGYDVNPDGSFNMWFGYMNRNYEEELDLPIGDANKFEPASNSSFDRGQPTHFAIRRHKDVFKVVVPKTFGDRQLVWTLTSHGQTEKVIGTLKPVWMIDRVRTTRGGNSEKVDSNTPPAVHVDPPEQTVANAGSATLTVSATDDGLPERNGKPLGMTVVWEKYRGPGSVVFTPAKAKITNGKASATAAFSEPGEYILQAVVDDGSGELAGNFGYHCCWTNVEVKVVVKK